MKKLCISIFICVFICLCPFAFGQSIGDFGSMGTGNWGSTNANWRQWDGSGWNTVPTGAPTATDNVFIRSDHIVKVDATGKNCLNLSVENGGQLNCQTASSRLVNVYGSIACNGTIGNGATTDGISFRFYGADVSISGSGQFDAYTIRKGYTTNATTNLTISMNVNLRYSSVALYNESATATDPTSFNITIESGDTLEFPTNGGSIGLDGSSASTPSTYENGGTLTVNGTLNLSAGTDGLYLWTDNNSSSVGLIIGTGGIVNADYINLTSTGTVKPTVTVANNGLLNLLQSGDYVTGQSTVDLQSGSTVKYHYNGNQNIHGWTYNNLIIGGLYNGTKTLAANTTVNGVLTLTESGQMASGGYTLTYGSSASLTYSGSNTTSDVEWPTTFDKNITINSSGKVTLNGNKSSYSGAITFSSGELDVANYSLSGSGSFNMTGSTKIYTSHANGIGTTGNFQLSGLQTFSTGGSYEYYSTSVDQYTGNSLPSTIANLILNNSKYAGAVYLSSSLTVSTLFTRKDGVLNLNGNTLTYGASAGLIYDNGVTDLTIGDELLSAMNGTVTLNGTGVVSLSTDNEINNTCTLNDGSMLRLWGNHVLTLNGNVSNSGSIYGEGNINFGGESFSNGANALIDPTTFHFSRAGTQSITGLSKFHNTVSTTIDSGATVGFGDGEILNLGGSYPFIVNNGGRLNISGTVTITGEGTINDYGTLFINSLSALLINGNNGVNTNTALTLNVYTNQINGSDGILKFAGYNQILAQNAPRTDITGGSLNLTLESGTLYVGPNTGTTDTTVFNGGFLNNGGTLTTSPSFVLFNSDFINYGTSNIVKLDFKGSSITNTGTITSTYIYFSNNGTQAVHGLSGIDASSDIKIKGMTGLNLSNTYSTPSQQVLTIGASATFLVETDAQLVIDGDITFTGALGCSSIPNQVCGTFTKNGTLSINPGKILRLTCGTVNIIGSNAIGSGTLGIGQETSTNNYLDETNLYFTDGMSINDSTLTVEFLDGSCTNVWDKVLNTDGPVIVSGVLRSGISCNYNVVGFDFNGDLTVNANGKISGVDCGNGNLLAPRPFIVRGNISNAGSEYLGATLNGTAQQSVSGNYSVLTLENSNGCLLNDNVVVSDTLVLTNGNITTGSKIVTIGTSTSSRGTLSRTAGTIIGNVKRWFTNAVINDVSFPVGTSSNFRPVTISFTDAPTTGGSLTVNFTPSNPGSSGLPLTDGIELINACASEGYWSILTGDSFAGGTYNIDLNADGFSGVSDFTALHLLKRSNSSSPWSLEGTHVVGTGTNSSPVIHRTGLTTFSEFGVGGGPANPLPVELTSFAATGIENKVILVWQTATEVNSFGFDIERSSSIGKKEIWSNIGFVNGSGNSASPKSYRFTDILDDDAIYSYRLKMIDNDGSFKYSHAIEVHVDRPLDYKLSQNYPNPFNPTTTIKYALPEASKVSIKVFNTIGEEVAELINEDRPAGYYQIDFDASALPSGVYFYRISANHFIQTRKMLLIK